MTSRKGFLGAGVAAAAAVFMPKSAAGASDDGGAAPEIEGSWFVQVPTVQGLTLSLQTYGRGGVFLESNHVRGILQPGSTGHGSWEKAGAHRYTKVVQWFSQPAGKPVLRVGVRELVEVSGDQFVILAAKRVRYRLDGNIEDEFPCESVGGIGTRIKAELPPCS